jgi:hypothetical protein
MPRNGSCAMEINNRRESRNQEAREAVLTNKFFVKTRRVEKAVDHSDPLFGMGGLYRL